MMRDMLREQGSSCGFTGPAGAAEAASMLGFYYQRQSSQDASVSVSIVAAEVRVAYRGRVAATKCVPRQQAVCGNIFG